MMKVLIVESEFLHQDTWVGNAVERLADALSQQNVTVIKSTSFDDGFAILSSNEAIDCLMFSYQMEHPDEHQNVRQLIGKLHERQQNVPVFLLGDREKALAAMDRDLLELVDEFALDSGRYRRLYRRTRRCRDDPLPPAAVAATVQRADEI